MISVFIKLSCIELPYDNFFLVRFLVSFAFRSGIGSLKICNFDRRFNLPYKRLCCGLIRFQSVSFGFIRSNSVRCAMFDWPLPGSYVVETMFGEQKVFRNNLTKHLGRRTQDVPKLSGRRPGFTRALVHPGSASSSSSFVHICQAPLP